MRASRLVMVSKTDRKAIRRFYRMHRAAQDMTQADVGNAARRHYPEFGKRRYEFIENGQDWPTPSERKALARVFRIAESELPTPLAQQSDMPQRAAS